MMKLLSKIISLLILFLVVLSCNNKTEPDKPVVEKRVTVEMVTDYGMMVIELYNKTPLHRDNFIKLIKENAYDSLLFHRVINEFMIQGGDPESKYAKPEDTLGSGGPSYTVDAEFNKDLFHKKGVLAAARSGNPKRASSAIQFYIVQGKVYNDSLLKNAEKRINEWLADHYSNNDPKNKTLLDSLQRAMDDEDWDRYSIWDDSLKTLAKDYDDFERYVIPEEHRIVYKSIGGTPHLDQNYTVYGEVIEGIEVLDSIAGVETGDFYRPKVDMRILSVRIKQ